MYIGGMFHWICPECGREIAPAVKECPVCDPQILPASSAAVSELAVAEKVPEPISHLALPLALQMPREHVVEPAQKQAESALAPAPEATHFETEPELIPDPVLLLALRLREERVIEPAPEQQESALANAPEVTDFEKEPELISDPARLFALRMCAEPVIEPAEDQADSALAPVPESISDEKEPEPIPDPALLPALQMRIVAPTPESPAFEKEPELIPDPVLLLALQMREEAQGQAESALAPAPESTSPEKEPELISDPALLPAIQFRNYAPTPESASFEKESGLISDPVLLLALQIREEAQGQAESALAPAPESFSLEKEPESIPDPPLLAALQMCEESQEQAESALAPAPESSSSLEKEPELISDAALLPALQVTTLAPSPESPSFEKEPELIPDPALLLPLRTREEDAEQPMPEPVEELAGPAIAASSELAGLTELAAALSSAVDTGSAQDDSAKDSSVAETEPAAPWPALQPQWQVLQLAAAPAAAALLAPPPLAHAPAPAPEPVAATAVPAAEFAALPLATVAALDSPVPIAVRATLPSVAGKPESEKAFSRPAPALPLAPLQDYTASASRRTRPVPPPPQIFTPDAGPRITLPGPVLPAQLHSLQNAGIAAITADPRLARKGGPHWLITVLVTVLLLGAGGFAVFTLLPRMLAGGNSAPPLPAAANPTPQEVEASTVSPVASYPLSKSVEVAGIRFSGDAGKKPEVHYVVVNHSGAGLDDMTVYVTLRASGAKPGQPPLSRFSFRTASLGPFESREMTSPIEKLPRTGALPEWQDLRADIELGP